MGPPCSNRISRVPPYSNGSSFYRYGAITLFGPAFQPASRYVRARPSPRSLATTSGVSVDFLSSGYLDVSVPRVRFKNPMCSGFRYLISGSRTSAFRLEHGGTETGRWVSPFGYLRLITAALALPQLIAECHVLHRLSMPRHPPNALLRLIQSRRRKTLGSPPSNSITSNSIKFQQIPAAGTRLPPALRSGSKTWLGYAPRLLAANRISVPF